MILIPDIETFVRFIPTAGGYNPDPELSNYDTVLPFLQEAEIYLRQELLGSDLVDYITASSDESLKDALRRIIAINAYHAAIPFVDLIQTPNGFAVVSNANQAPASAERVKRLLEWLRVRLSEAVDRIIVTISTDAALTAEWKKSENYLRYTECLFMTASSLQRYGKREAVRDDLDELHPSLMSYQEDMGKMVSFEYIAHLIDLRRNPPAAFTPEDIQVFKSLQVILGLYVKGEHANAALLLSSLVNTMVRDIANYPVYEASQAYRIKISEIYQNRKEDKAFFFNP